MAVPAEISAPLTGISLIDVLTQGSRWSFPDGNRQITYSLWNSPEGSWTPQGTALVDNLFDLISQYVDVRFVARSPTGSLFNNDSDISIVLSASLLRELDATPGAFGEAAWPSAAAGNALLAQGTMTRSSYPTVEGDVFVDSSNAAYGYFAAGGAGRTALLRLIGRALGLKDPGESANGHPSLAETGLAIASTRHFSVMGDALDPANYAHGNLVTFGVLDVLALQSLYGANTATGAGDTAYTLGQSGYNQTIWDIGGTDLFDASAATGPVLLDLRDSAISRLVDEDTRVGIAVGAVIENARGGSSSDLLRGNPVANELDGNGGDDTVYAGAGSDFVRGLDGNDLVYGEAGDDDINGNMGQDHVYGGPGADFVRGGQGNDTIFGEEDDDVHINGNIGNDIVYGGAGSDFVFGGQNDDLLFGEDGSDTLSGDLGNDTLTGGAGADRFAMGSNTPGADVITDFNAAAGDQVQLSAGNNIQVGSSGGNAVVTLTNGGSITFQGLAASDVRSSWFVFV